MAVLITTFLLWPKISLASSSGLVVDEFRTRSKTIITDEYIILKNYGKNDINLLNYSLVKKVSSGNKYTLVGAFPDYIIKPGQKVFVYHKDYSGIYKDIIYSTSYSLADSDNAIVLYNPQKQIIDSVAYGEVEFLEAEGLPLDNPQAGISYKRINGQDTDNNMAGFEAVIEKIILDPNVNKILITELVPDPNEGDEWFELYNPTSQTVSLKGLKICDQLGRTHCYSFPNEELIKSRQYKTYDRSITKITLNNDGDWLELQDNEENIYATSGADYGDAEPNASLSLFNDGWKWSQVMTKGGANIFIDIVENEPKTKKTKKASTKKSTSTSSERKSKSTEGDGSEDSSDVKGSEAINPVASKFINKKVVGVSLIILAFLLILGYTVWDKREKASEIFKRFGRKNN